MASPQKENGYTPIANELLEAIYRTNFTSTELKTILFTMRYTYGFSRKEHELSLNFISKGIGISKRYISSSVSKLIEDNVLQVVREHTDTQSRIIKLNKNYNKWMNRTTVQQMKYSSTDDTENNTTGEVQFNTTGELEFHQDKQNIKQNIKQGASDLFPLFWVAYPRKVSKVAAKKVFDKLKVDDSLLKQMLKALDVQKQSRQWQTKEYIPHPTTWLNQRRWEDEIEEEQEEALKQTDTGLFKL